MKKRGYFLVECSIYLSICAVILSLVCKLIIPYLNELNYQNKSLREYKYLLNTEIYISNRINEAKLNFIECRDNEVYINMSNDYNQVDIIKKKIDKLVVEYYKHGSKVGENILLRDVEYFNTINKNNLVYVVIKQKNKNERVFCYEKK